MSDDSAEHVDAEALLAITRDFVIGMYNKPCLLSEAFPIDDASGVGEGPGGPVYAFEAKTVAVQLDGSGVLEGVKRQLQDQITREVNRRMLDFMEKPGVVPSFFRLPIEDRPGELAKLRAWRDRVVERPLSTVVTDFAFAPPMMACPDCVVEHEGDGGTVEPCGKPDCRSWPPTPVPVFLKMIDEEVA